jgi:hypothetical protein
VSSDSRDVKVGAMDTDPRLPLSQLAPVLTDEERLQFQRRAASEELDDTL